MFWGALDVAINVALIQGTVSPLIVPRKKALVGSIEEAVRTFQI